MFTATALLVTIAVYMAVLFALAQVAERTNLGRRLSNHPAVFALGLAVYCTTWTYYGSVGKAAVGGMSFLPVYLGPTLALLVGGTAFRRILELKEAHKLTSIADFISARYAKSQRVAALVTVILAVGIVPYIALQIKAVTATFSMLTSVTGTAAPATSGIGAWFGPIVVVTMIVFTIVFGIRHLDPTERHPGMVVSLAAESVVKLVAFLAAGAFVVGAAFGGIGGFAHAIDRLDPSALPVMGKASGNDVSLFVTVTFLSMAAFCFVPRQFHVGVVEGTQSSHVRTAQWLTPLYLVAINVFVVPIALGGKSLAAAGTSADYYVLALPMQAGKHGLSLAVFIGGFSAAIGMIMVESMTLATMISNHLALPLIMAVPALRGLRRRTLQVRWAAAASITGLGYAFAVALGNSYMLVAIGLISFAAAALLAPVVIGGLYWRSANRVGALAGLSAGFVAWAYTLFLPTFVKSHWLPESILKVGPWGISALKPEALFGWNGLPPLAHGSLWSMLATTTVFIVGSVVAKTSKDERLLTEAFLDTDANQLAHLDATFTIPVEEQRLAVHALLRAFFGSEEAAALTSQSLDKIVGNGAEKMSVMQKAELYADVERKLAGAIGAASAHNAMKQLGTIDRKDKRTLEREFAKALASLNISPKELKQRIDFQKERDTLLDEQFAALQEKITQRDAEIVTRQKAEVALQTAHDELECRVVERTKEIRAILDNVVFGFLCIDRDMIVREGFTQSCMELLGAPRIGGCSLLDLLALTREVDREQFALSVEQVYEDFMPEQVSVSQMPQRFAVGGRALRVEARPVRDDAGNVAILLMTISDITTLEAVQRENEDNRALLNILKQRSSFEAFLSDTKQRLREAEVAVNDGDDVVVRRTAHTIKGNVSLYGISHVARLIHEIEEQPAIEHPHLERIGQAMKDFLSDNAHVLGLDFEESPSQGRSLTVTEAQIEGLRDIATRLPEPEAGILVQLLREMSVVRASVLLGPVQALVDSVADRLGKRVKLELVGADALVDPSLLGPIFQNLPHLVRNALDHGIEQPHERGEKPDFATLAIRISTSGSDYVVEVEDDGRGIDAEQVAAAAERKGLLTPTELANMTEDDKLQLIFEDRVSTAETVSDISGRGVGMSAIRATVESLGGQILIETGRGRGTRISLCVPGDTALDESRPMLRAS